MTNETADKLSEKEASFHKHEGEGTFAKFFLLPRNAISFEQGKTHTVKINPARNLIEQVRQVGLVLNGSTESLFPHYIANYVYSYTVRISQTEKTILKEQPSHIYFGDLVIPPSNRYEEGRLYGLSSVKESVGQIDEYLAVLTRTGTTFDLTNLDTVIAATPNGDHIRQGQIIYAKGAPVPFLAP